MPAALVQEQEAEVALVEAAQRLGLSWHAAWRRVLTGDLDGHKDREGRWRVTESSIVRLAQGAVSTNASAQLAR